MSVESYIQAMPKANLGLQLEGAFPKQSLIMIAEQNEIPASMKGFKNFVQSLDEPDYAKLHDIFAITSQWVRHPDDLSRLVYDTGVALSKQNVRYAEIGVNPLLYMANDMTFEHFVEALSDGRDRAQRGWKIRMNWILNIPREEPRRGDEITRWALSATGRKNGVIGIGLTGREDVQPVGQFERVFRNAEKKDLSRILQAGGKLGVEGLVETVKLLKPTRLICNETLPNAPELIAALVEEKIPLDICPGQALVRGKIPAYGEYPVRALYDDDVKLTVSERMPLVYKTSLTQEYQQLVEQGVLSLEELEEVALNAVRYSLLPGEDKTALLNEFSEAYQQLRAEHITTETT
jgi:aminodeoxyfutalosine deaminase